MEQNFLPPVEKKPPVPLPILVAGAFVILALSTLFWLTQIFSQKTEIKTPPPTTQGGVAILTENNNGKTVSVTVGTQISLNLSSTLWTIGGSSDSSVVMQAQKQTTSSSGNCPPGVGCGFSTANFTALKKGTAQISASRTSCGEAVKCTPEQGSFKVTIEVN